MTMLRVRHLLLAAILTASGASFAADPKRPAGGSDHAVPPPTGAMDLRAVPPQRRGAVVLPGIGSPGQAAMPATAQNLIRIGQGGNEIVYIGLGVLNRIGTPFKEPKLIEASGVEFRRVGQDIYLLTDKETPVGVFIAEGASGASSNQVASMTLIPRPGLPGQNILLVLEGGSVPGAQAATEELPAPPADYTDAIRQIVVAFVQGTVPPGFQEGTLRVGMARVGSIVVSPEKMFTSYAFNVFRYRVENVGREPLDLNETSFHEDGVRAVAFWRNARLAPGEATSVIIVADRGKHE